MSLPTRTEDDDDRIGIPRPRLVGATTAPPAPAPVPPEAATEPDPAVELRAGDTELGRPPQVPRHLAPLTAADLARLRELDEQAAARELEEIERLIESDPAGTGWLGWFGAPLVFAFLVGMGGVFGLVFLNQTLSLIQALRAQPEWAQYIGFAGLGLFAACVGYAVLRFGYLYLRLRRNRQLRLQGIEELSRRTRLRWLVDAKAAEAREQVEQYLRTYPLDSEKDRRTLRALGLDDAAQARLAAARDQLLDPNRFASTGQWFSEFRDRFQAELDAAAEARVRYWGNRVWVVTAVAPNAAIDAGASLFYAFSMLNDLCRLYNLRAGRVGTAVLLGRLFFNAYLAGQGTEWEKIAEDQYDQLFTEALNTLGIGISSNVVGKLLGKVGAKATTGYLNRLLLMRLGRYAMRLLRPVARD